MRTARVAYGGALFEAVPHAQGLRLPDGRVLREDQVVWLPPLEVGTIIALGLNYAEHAKELAKELSATSKDEPLVFLKGPNSLVGHRGFTRRPADVSFMHYECELAVIIGKRAQRVPRRRSPSAGVSRGLHHRCRHQRAAQRVLPPFGAEQGARWFLPDRAAHRAAL